VTAVSAARGRSGILERWFGRYASALRAHDLRLLLAGLVISETGTWAFNVALLAFVFNRTHSLGWVGAAGLVRFLPALVLSPYGGVLAERMERVRLMVSSDVLCALWQGGLVAVAAADGPVAVALVLAGLTAATNIVYPPAVAATIPSVVQEDDLVAANALNGTIENLVVVVGPAIGALLVVVASPAGAFGVNAASFAISAVLVSRIRTRSRPDPQAVADSSLRQIADGVRTVVSLPPARTLVAFCALVSFVYGTDTVLFMGVSAQRLGTGSHGFGYLLAGLGIGGILMAPAVDRLARSTRLAPIILGGALGYCLPTALLTVIHSPGLALAVQVVRGAATLVVDVLAITALQRAVPTEQLGRVFGLFFAFVLGAISLGALITPAVVSAIGLNGGLLVMAFAPAALAMLGAPALVRIDRETHARAKALAPRVDLLEQLDLFAAAPRPTLERLASVASEVEFALAQPIVREGEPGDALYVLVEGEVEVTAAEGPGGHARRIREMHAPAYFGEIGVLEHIPRTATVTAVTPCRCLRIEGSALLNTLANEPASSSLMENARSRLAITHPSATISYGPTD
jgi:CRP-like cAMP-binding protein